MGGAVRLGHAMPGRPTCGIFNVGAVMGALFGSSKSARVLPPQKGITNAEAQAQSNLESADRAKERLRKASLANLPRTSLLNEDLEERILS